MNMMESRVTWSKGVDRQLVRVPSYLRDKFMAWVILVQRVGLLGARKFPGYHDEPLKGDRKGQRSVRLNRAYRVIYVERIDGRIQIVDVLEVSKHEY